MLLTLAGWTSSKIAEAFGVREDTVRLWRSDFTAGGVAALKTSIAPGPPPGKRSSPPCASPPPSNPPADLAGRSPAFAPRSSVTPWTERSCRARTTALVGSKCASRKFGLIERGEAD